MKIITDNAVYVQKLDLICTLHQPDTIPESIILKVFRYRMIVIDNSNKDEFVKFESDDEIDFFRNIDWIIDYNTVKDLTNDEIKTMIQDMLQKRNSIAKNFNSLSKEEQRKHLEDVYTCRLLDYKIYSLQNILGYKKGINKWRLPKEVDDSSKELKQADEKGVKKFIKRIFRRAAK